jgi:hypothetical protein
MRRALFILFGACCLILATYLLFSKFGIRHDALTFFDASRGRQIAVELAVRRDAKFRADAGYTTLPVAIISQGNTVKNTEYSFLANVLAARGYLVASVQNDLPTDPPLMTVQGSLYVGRLGVYEVGEANILYVIKQLEKIQPHADYQHLTLVGHSNGGDISMFFAQQHPDLVRTVITLDNLRVPFVIDPRIKILSFRSQDPKFITDPGVLPSKIIAKQDGIDIVQTNARHTEMSDRGPADVKDIIQQALDEFLNSSGISSSLSKAETDKLIVTDPLAMGP